MKDFDIEKLKRENIFKTPEGFLEDMQSKVLQEIVPVKRGRIINLNWAYGAAAAVALLIGVSVVLNSDPEVERQASTEVVIANSDSPATFALAEVQKPIEEAVALKVLEEDLTSVAQLNQNVNAPATTSPSKKTTDFAVQKIQKASPNPEFQVDQILASFTSAEMADVGKNTEQDIYLDLYN